MLDTSNPVKQTGIASSVEPTSEHAQAEEDTTNDSGSENASISSPTFQDLLTNLVHQLNQSSSSTDALSTFVDAMECMHPGLCHISLLLLPTMQAARQAAKGTTAEPKPATSPLVHRRPSKQNKAKDGPATSPHTRVPFPNPSPEQPHPSGTLLGGIQEFDWHNTCQLNLYKGRGPVVQPPPDWPLVCSAAYYAATITDGVLTTSDYGQHGPHFLDWKALAEKGAVSITSVPIYCWKQPVAVLTMACSNVNAFGSDDTMVLLSAVLSPYVQQLEYTTRRQDMERLVHSVLTPLAAELSVKQGRFKRIKNVHGEDVLCLDETRSLYRSKPEMKPDPAAEATPPPGTPKRTLASIQGSCLGIGMAGPSAGHRSHGHPLRSASQALGRIASKSEMSGMQRRGMHTNEATESQDLDWSDFLFNLISMCIVYAYFSKAAASSESVTAVLLCMAVAAFDILLLLMRWLWYDHYMNYGLVLCVFQVYRIILLPIANTWMLWSLTQKLGVEVTALMHVTQGVVLCLCFVFARKMPFLLNVPVQLLTVVFSASTAVNMCGPLETDPNALICMTFITSMQLVVGLVLPVLMLYLRDMHGGRSFMPHVQAKRWILQ